MENIGIKLKQIRKSKGISQIDAAKAAGITQSSYASIESGKTKAISIQVGLGLAQILEEDFNALFGIESKKDESLQELEELRTENRTLKLDLDVYRSQLQFMKENNMIMSPHKRKNPDEPYKFSDENTLLEEIGESVKEQAKYLEYIKSNPGLLAELKKSNVSGWFGQELEKL